MEEDRKGHRREERNEGGREGKPKQVRNDEKDV